MKKILAVNIDAITLNIITSLLSEHTEQFEVLTTEQIGEINDIIKKLTTDLIVIDLDNPSPGDLEILSYIAKSYPKIPLLVMTAFETAEIESSIKSIERLRYFEKPADFKEIANTIFEELESGVGGEIHGISLSSFLQMSEMEKTSCTLKINADEQTGYLYLVKGSLIAAETPDLKNEEAVYEILGWENPTIEIEEAPTGKKKEIQTPLMNLLMEGARRKDEKTSGEKGTEKTKLKQAKQISIKSAAELAAEEEAPPEEEEKKTKEKKKKGKAKKTEPATEEEAEQLEELKASGKITDASLALKRKRLLGLAVKIGAAVALLIGLACLWQFAVRPWLAQSEFKKTMASVEQASKTENKIEILEKYLATDPDPQRARIARRKKQSLQSELQARAFDETVRKVSDLPLDDNFKEKAKKIYNNYLERYPHSEYADEIKNRINKIPTLLNDAECRKLKKIPKDHYSKRLAAYNRYLQKYPESENTPKVKEMLSQLGEDFYHHIQTARKKCDKQKKWTRCLKLCRYFLNNFEQHARRDDVKNLKTRMEDKAALLTLTKKAKEKGRYTEATKEVYLTYLDEHPQTTIKETLQKKIKRIKTYRQQTRQWEQLCAFVKNSNIDIFERFERMRRYVNNNPPQRYRQEAEAVLARLKAKKETALQNKTRQEILEEQRKRQQAAIERKKMEIREKMAASGGRYVEKKKNTIYDTQTGLTWCMLDSSVMTDTCIDYEAAKQYVNDLDTGGYHDWRLPDPRELLVIYNGSPPFPAQNAGWYWTSKVFSAAWKKKVNTVKKTGEDAWRKHETDLNKCGAVRAVRP